MKSTQTVYISDKPLVFFYVYNTPLPAAFEGFTVLNEESTSIANAIEILLNTNEYGVVFMSENVNESWKSFVSNYVLIEAAGGLVRNSEGEILFIFRNGKWDLPKGKAEYDETPEETALREVEEECGIKGLEIEKEIMPTFHTYIEKRKSILKKTHWYFMTCEQEQNLIPQMEEGITEVKWFDKKKIIEIVLKNTYTSIKRLLEEILN